jgi:hypothetical protein
MTDLQTSNCRITIETGDPEVAMQICGLLKKQDYSTHGTSAETKASPAASSNQAEAEYKSFLDIPGEIHGTTKQHLHDVSTFIAAYNDQIRNHPELVSKHRRIMALKKLDNNPFPCDKKTYYGYLAELKNWRQFYLCHTNFSARYPDDPLETVVSLITKEQPTTFPRSEKYYLNLLTYREYFEPYLH